jgi:RNA polymerase sigma factor (TIGR02999 family)
MRQVLIDHARRRGAEKRGGSRERLPIDAALELFAESGPDLVVLDEALRRLEALDPELVRIVELRFFAGASNPEIAAALGVSTRTVERGWKTAQSWLREELGRADAAES